MFVSVAFLLVENVVLSSANVPIVVSLVVGISEVYKTYSRGPLKYSRLYVVMTRGLSFNLGFEFTFLEAKFQQIKESKKERRILLSLYNSPEYPYFIKRLADTQGCGCAMLFVF